MEIQCSLLVKKKRQKMLDLVFNIYRKLRAMISYDLDFAIIRSPTNLIALSNRYSFQPTCPTGTVRLTSS